MLPLLAFLVAGALADERPQNDPETAANIDFAEAVRETVELQSQGLDEATVRVHRAYVYRDSAHRWSGDLPDSLKLVVVDVTFQGYSAGLDLGDVDIIDAETSRNYGSSPILFGVLPDGRPADIDDPVILQQEESLRTLLIYGLPKDVTHIQLGYWGELLTPEATKLEAAGPELPAPRIVSARATFAEPPSGDFDRILVLLEVRNWSRIREPRRLVIRCGREIGDIDRYIELDETLRPLKESAKLPPFVPRRYFLIDYWVPAGCDARQLWSWTTRQDLEWDLSGLPTATLAALERTEHLEYALHRLGQ